MIAGNALVKAVQIKLLGEQHRRLDPQDVGIGRIALVRLPHGVGPRIGASLRRPESGFSGVLCGLHEASRLLFPDHKNAVVSIPGQ